MAKLGVGSARKAGRLTELPAGLPPILDRRPTWSSRIEAVTTGATRRSQAQVRCRNQPVRQSTVLSRLVD